MRARTVAGLLVMVCAGCSLLTSTDGLSGGPLDPDGGTSVDAGDGSTSVRDGAIDSSILEGGADGGGKVFLVAAGGLDTAGGGLDSVTVAPLQGAALGAWTPMTKVPVAEETFTRVVGYGGRVFVFFDDSVASNEVRADGSALWSPQPSYPRARGRHCVAAAGDTAYVIGGSVSGQATVAVDRANLSQPLLTWSMATSLPATPMGTGGRQLLGCAANADYVYVVAGKDSNSAHLDEVLYARRDASGALGNWTTTTKLPSTAYWPVVAATSSHVYVVGGAYDTLDPRTVLTSAINADGSLGLWQITTQLPMPIDRPGVVAVADRMFIAGGGGGSPVHSLTEVYSAPVGAQGALGAWATMAPMTIGRQSHGLAFALLP